MSTKFVAVTEAHVFVKKNGKMWQRVREMNNPPNITACDCCAPKGLLPLPPNDGTDPPTEEEWQAARLIADKEWGKNQVDREAAEQEREMKKADARAQEEKEKSKKAYESLRALDLVIGLRYGDAMEHCRIYGLDYGDVVRLAKKLT